MFNATRNITIQNGGTFTDNGYRVQINATGSDSGSLFVGGTDTAFGGIGRTMLISSSLSASANNDTLVGLDINPTFTNGAFTGVTNLFIRLGTQFQFRSDGVIQYGPSSARGRLTWDNSGAYFCGQTGYGVGLGANSRLNDLFITTTGLVGIGTTGASSKLQVVGAGTTSATTTFLLQNSTPTTLMTVLDNGQFTYTTPTMTLAASQSAYTISPVISGSSAIGANYYGVNITPTFYQTTASQNETAFRVAATFTQSSAAATGGTNVIADFGATSVGSQLTVTDITSGSIYMVNDVSGLPIIEATSDWTVNMYNFPTKVFQKTGSQVIISGSLWINASGSFSFPLTSSVNPPVGSAFWSGSSLYIYDGLKYKSASFA